jgi:hypothetical protein
MSRDLVERLEQWKRRFDPAGAGQLERLLAGIARHRFRDAEALIRLHETLLFLRAYPLSRKTARLADAILSRFVERVAGAAGGEAFEDPAVSGIAGTPVTAVFGYETARRLAALHPRGIDIGWDCYDEPDRLGPVIQKFLPMLHEDWPVEAHTPFRQWIAGAHSGRTSDLQWLLDRLSTLPVEMRADSYESLQLPLTWQMGRSRNTRSALRLPVRSLYLHGEPLLRRGDVSLDGELAGPPLPVKRLARPEARRILDIILETSAMRYRELYGFSHPDEAGVYHAAAGRGVEIYFFGVPPAWRLPLRAYCAGMFFKNGVPAGYVELLSLFERSEVGFNLYYTFREGESAWLYARILRLFRQVLGVTCFSVDPYQIGDENPEAVESGAFWFYRKLGFRATAPEVARLVAREEDRMRKTAGYRSSKRTLQRLAKSPILYEVPGSETGDWDHFNIRTLAQRLQQARPGSAESRAAEQIAQAKRQGDEVRYLRWMQRDSRLREMCVRWGQFQAAIPPP